MGLLSCWQEHEIHMKVMESCAVPWYIVHTWIVAHPSCCCSALFLFLPWSTWDKLGSYQRSSSQLKSFIRRWNARSMALFWALLTLEKFLTIQLAWGLSHPVSNCGSQSTHFGCCMSRFYVLHRSWQFRLNENKSRMYDNYEQGATRSFHVQYMNIFTRFLLL